MIRVLLADDHPLLTAGLKMILDEWPEFSVVGTASDGAEAVELCDKLLPDLVIMDMQMPKLSGAEAIARIKAGHPDIKILALTTFEDDETVTGAMQSGCDGFLLKVIEKEKFRASLLSITEGLNVYDESAIRRYNKEFRSRRETEFSDREKEILGLICDGLTNTEIANKLKLRAGTIKNLVSLLLSKTNCISRTQLARYASEKHIVPEGGIRTPER